MACGTYASDKALALRFYEVYKVQKVRGAKVQTFEFCHRPVPLRGAVPGGNKGGQESPEMGLGGARMPIPGALRP